MSAGPEPVQAGATRRILTLIALMAAAGTVAAACLAGYAMAFGLALGAAACWTSFFWLVGSMRRLTAIAAGNPETKFSVLGLGLRFLLRYALVALVAYGMMKSSHGSAVGFAIGLLLIVPALFLESAYLLLHSRRHEV
jgi:hypothetical protein